MSNSIFRAIFERLQEHERRLAGMEVRGKVKEVDIEQKRVRLLIGKDEDGGDVLSPWVPYAQTAGDLKFHNPPSVGQPMKIGSETGDIEQGTAQPYHWSDDNPSPSELPDRHVATFGNFRMVLTPNSLKLSIGGTSMLLTGEGVRVDGRLDTVRGIHDRGGVFSEVAVWPPASTFVPVVTGTGE